MNKPFSALSTIESPSHLKLRTLEAISAARKRASFVRMIGLGALEIASVAAGIASFIYAGESLMSSGVWSYVSLVFTDGSTVLSYSKELALSVLEALPAASLAIGLCATVAFAWSTARLIRISKTSIRFA